MNRKEALAKAIELAAVQNARRDMDAKELMDLVGKLQAGLMRLAVDPADGEPPLVDLLDRAAAPPPPPAPPPSPPAPPVIPAAAPGVSGEDRARMTTHHDHLDCIECGRPYQILASHLISTHGMTADEYKSKWDLPADYMMISETYRLQRHGHAVRLGLGRNPEDKPAPAPPTA